MRGIRWAGGLAVVLGLMVWAPARAQDADTVRLKYNDDVSVQTLAEQEDDAETLATGFRGGIRAGGVAAGGFRAGGVAAGGFRAGAVGVRGVGGVRAGAVGVRGVNGAVGAVGVRGVNGAVGAVGVRGVGGVRAGAVGVRGVGVGGVGAVGVRAGAVGVGGVRAGAVGVGGVRVGAVGVRGGWGWGGWGWGGRGWGWGGGGWGYPGWGWGGWGVGYPAVVGYGYYPCSTVTSVGVSSLVLPSASGYVMSPDEPPAQPMPGASDDATYPYDGGPTNPVPGTRPMPRAEPAPAAPSSAPSRSVPLEGRAVSLPRSASKWTYPAYGEQARRAPAVTTDREVLTKK